MPEATATTMDHFQFGVLGPLTLTRAGVEVAVGSPKQRMLLACLLVVPNSVVPLADLAEVLWADTDPPASAETTLRSLVSRLRVIFASPQPHRRDEDAGLGRRIQRDGLLVGRDGGYLLRVAAEQTDRGRFERHLADARAARSAGQPTAATEALEAGLSLWRGRAFADIVDTALAEVAIAGLEKSRVEAVEALGDAQLAAGQPARALATLEPLLVEHPFREHGWETLLLALYRSGRQAEALSAYQTVRQRLRDELGVEPRPSLRRLHRRILLQQDDLDPASAPPVTTSQQRVRATPTTLPNALTPLVGREVEVGELSGLLEHTRLLTLTGIGGAGKTRLALALASAVTASAASTSRFPEGARLVELAAVTDPGLVAAHTAGAFDVPSAGASDSRLLHHRLVEFLAEQRVLIVLDNCEHVLAPIAQLAEALLSGCPNLVVLTTSREPLAVPGEVIYPVPALSLPPANAAEPAELLKSGAVALFCQRATAAQIGFGITEDNAAAIAAICRRLDGIPLALELAAGRLRSMSAQDVADRLDNRFRLLTGGARTALPRQQTLRAALDWSFELLSREEQTLLCRLSVFPGTFNLAAAEYVGSAASEYSSTATELVPRLVDKSLIDVRGSAGAVRYRLLETVKAYCAERKSMADQINQAERRHCAHYVGLAAAQRAQSRVHWDVGDWVHHCLIEDDNHRAAISYALAHDDTDAALIVLGALWHVWLWTGRSENLAQWFRTALAGPLTDEAAHVEALIGFAFLSAAWELTDAGGPQRLFTQAREVAQRLDDETSLWRADYFHTEFLLLRGQRRAAKAAFLSAERSTTNGGLRGWCNLNLGWIALGENDVSHARERFRIAVGLGRTDSRILVPHALAALAPLTAIAGESPAARKLAAEAVSSAEELPLPGVWAMALVRAGQTQLLCGDFSTAAATLNRLFETFKRIHGRRFHAEAFDAAGVLAAHHRDHLRAARYSGVSQSLRTTRVEDNSGVDVLDALVKQSHRDSVNVLGAHRYSNEQQAGAAMAPFQALTDASQFCKATALAMSPTPIG